MIKTFLYLMAGLYVAHELGFPWWIIVLMMAASWIFKDKK